MTGKKVLKNIVLTMIMFCMAFTVISVNSKADAATISLSAKSVTMRIAGTKTIKLKNATASKVQWYSRNKSYATVKAGKITARKAGTATIIAKYKGKQYSCKVTIKKPYISVSSTSVSIPVNGTKQSPTKASYYRYLTYTSADTSIAKVSSTGKITGVSEGKTTIKVKAKAGTVYTTKTITVNVHEVYVKSITIPSSKEINTTTGTNSYQFNPTISPSNTSKSKLEWYVDGNSTAFFHPKNNGLLYFPINKTENYYLTVYAKDTYTGVESNRCRLLIKYDISSFFPDDDDESSLYPYIKCVNGRYYLHTTSDKNLQKTQLKVYGGDEIELFTDDYGAGSYLVSSNEDVIKVEKNYDNSLNLKGMNGLMSEKGLSTPIPKYALVDNIGQAKVYVMSKNGEKLATYTFDSATPSYSKIIRNRMWDKFPDGTDAERLKNILQWLGDHSTYGNYPYNWDTQQGMNAIFDGEYKDTCLWVYMMKGFLEDIDAYYYTRQAPDVGGANSGHVNIHAEIDGKIYHIDLQGGHSEMYSFQDMKSNYKYEFPCNCYKDTNRDISLEEVLHK